MSERHFQEDAHADALPVRIKRGTPDWRNADSYRHLLELDADGWAWEWLRRNPAYIEQAKSTPLPVAEALRRPPRLVPSSACIAADWGLHFRGASVNPRVPGETDLARRLLTFRASGRRASRCSGSS